MIKRNPILLMVIAVLLINFTMFSVSLTNLKNLVGDDGLGEGYGFWSTLLSALLWLAPNQIYFLFPIDASAINTIIPVIFANLILVFITRYITKMDSKYYSYGIVPFYVIFSLVATFLLL